jgi:glycosyltransferase involved in cell wall biosynthesis
MIKVSVIIPSLNVGAYIKECIQSVMHQTLTDIEIICVDAGSTDGTREQLETFAKIDPRIRIIDSNIKSYGYQVNAGIEHAIGRYIGIVESDDYVDESIFEYLYELAECYNVDVAKADTFIMYDNGDVKVRHTLPKELSDKYFCVIDNTQMLELHELDENLWNGIYKRSMILEKGIRLNTSKGAAFQDIGFQQQVHMLAESFVYSNIPRYYYRMDRDGSSTNLPGWLNYVLQESKFLERICPQHVKEWNIHRGAIHARLAASFSVELERTLILNNFSWHGSNWLDTYFALQQMIRGWMNASDIDTSLLTSKQKLNIEVAIESLESYTQLIKTRIKLNAENRDLVLHTAGDHQCVVFGAGQWGRAACAMLEMHQKKVLSYTDNDPSIWHTSIDGKAVLPPNEAIQRNSDVIFVVANKMHSKEIIQQLRHLGIPHGQIVSYSAI